MSHYVNVSNSWKTTKQTYVNVSGSWKSCINIYVKASNEWKPLYNYWWATGDWSTCSATCGGGTQTRAVTCYRSHAANNALDQQAVIDTYCTKTVGTKPITQQSCNTQSCNECRYIKNQYHWYVLTRKGVPKELEIIWSSNSVYSSVGGSLTTITTGGYKYDRNGTYKDRIYSSGYYHSYYEVCRSSI